MVIVYALFVCFPLLFKVLFSLNAKTRIITVHKEKVIHMTKSKQTVSSLTLGFVAAFSVLSIWEAINNLQYMVSGLYIVEMLMRLLRSCTPFALYVILVLSRSGKEKRLVIPILIFLGCVPLVSTVLHLINTRFLLSIFALYDYVTEILVGCMLLISAWYIHRKKNNHLLRVMACVGGVVQVAYFFVVIFEGQFTVQPVVTMLLFCGLCTFPLTVYDPERCAQDVDFVHPIIFLLIFLLIISCVSRCSADGEGDGVNTCRVCGRRTQLVEGFGMCGSCYSGFNDYLKEGG